MDHIDDNLRRPVPDPETVPRQVMDVMRVLYDIAGITGFEIVGCLALRDRATGREYRW